MRKLKNAGDGNLVLGLGIPSGRLLIYGRIGLYIYHNYWEVKYFLGISCNGF